MKNAILGIDLQNDFVKTDGALSVNGALDDVERIYNFIVSNMSKIDHIALTLDSHHPIHIAHATFWRDKMGNNPQPFTNITLKDIQDGNWTANYNPNNANKYIEALEKVGKTHTIWTEHCILGTEGHALHYKIYDAVRKWEIFKAKPFNFHFKGSNWYTEHYSIFKAEVVLPNCQETSFNFNLIKELEIHDRVFLVGEAADFCVANSLNDIVNETPVLAKKVVVLEDCMSWIINKNPDAVKIFNNAKASGVTFAKSTDNLF